MLELREAICQKLDRENGLSYEPKIFSCRMEKTKFIQCMPGDI